MMNYINLYYLYNWSFELLQRVRYALALYVMFIYIMNSNFIKKPKQIKIKESEHYA